MAMLNKVVKIAARPLPDMISPRTHAVVDYMMAGSFLAGAAWFWKNNKRAAVGALLCGGAQLAVSLLTDYPGGSRRVIKFAHRRQIDLGLAAMTTTMPSFLNFKDEPQRHFFTAQGVLLTAASELTKFPEARGSRERSRAA